MKALEIAEEKARRRDVMKAENEFLRNAKAKQRLLGKAEEQAQDANVLRTQANNLVAKASMELKRKLMKCQIRRKQVEVLPYTGIERCNCRGQGKRRRTMQQKRERELAGEANEMWPERRRFRTPKTTSGQMRHKLLRKQSDEVRGKN